MDSDDKVLIVKIAFIIACFLEGLISSYYPTWNRNCRENPKIMGIANAFACGVFIAIALMHILPEEVEAWANLDFNVGKENLFPLPEMLMFIGYTIILLVDKVLFDTSALFEDNEGKPVDPAAQKLAQDIKTSMQGKRPSPGELDATEAQATEEAMKSYLNPHDRFATRMKASMGKSDPPTNEEQQALFVDGAQI